MIRIEFYDERNILLGYSDPLEPNGSVKVALPLEAQYLRVKEFPQTDG